MFGSRKKKKLERAYDAMEAAGSYADWQEAAAEVDRLQRATGPAGDPRGEAEVDDPESIPLDDEVVGLEVAVGPAAVVQMQQRAQQRQLAF